MNFQTLFACTAQDVLCRINFFEPAQCGLGKESQCVYEGAALSAVTENTALSLTKHKMCCAGSKRACARVVKGDGL